MNNAIFSQFGKSSIDFTLTFSTSLGIPRPAAGSGPLWRQDSQAQCRDVTGNHNTREQRIGC
jgi:hypothetical protein